MSNDIYGKNMRNVDFSKIHGDNSEAYAKLMNALHLENGMVVGDFMGGYGDAAGEILKYADRKGLSLHLMIIDQSPSQIKRSRQFLSEFETKHTITRFVEDARSIDLPDSCLDRTVIKLGLHEVKREQQPRVLEGVFKTLKPKGEFFIWACSGRTEELTDWFRKIVLSKDMLAGYHSFVENRWFSDFDELERMLKSAGFADVQQIYEGELNLDSLRWAEADFGITNLNYFNEWLRRLPDNIKTQVNFRDYGEGISMDFTKRIYRAKK